MKISDEHRTTAYQILNDPVRRFVLSYLNGQAEDVPIERLANDYTTHAHQHATNESTKRLRMRLHHVHLPYLADAGLIEYDHDTHRITDWRHPNLNDQWLTQTPVEPLAETIVSVQHARE